MSYAEDRYLVCEYAHISAPALTAELNRLAADGWQLTHVVGDRHYFERELTTVIQLDHELLDPDAWLEKYAPKEKHAKKGKK